MAKRYIMTYVVLFVQIFAIIAIQAATTFNNIGLTNDNPGKISQSKDDNTQPSDEKTLDRLNKEETVSLFTGDIAFPVSLISLPGRNGLDLTVSMKYSNTDVDRISVTSNLKTPTGILGLGWSLGYDRIVINNNSTNDSEDDVYYLYSGNGMSKLIPVETTEENGIKTVHFVLKDDIYTKVTYTESEEIWMLTDSNGISKTFGGLAATNALNEPLNSVQWGVTWGNSIWVSSSNEITNQRRYPIAWNVSYVTNRYNERIEYRYTHVVEQVNSGGYEYTKACYLSKIIDSYAHVIDFVYLDKELFEFVDPYTCAQEPDAYQEKFETKYLHRINTYSMNNLISSVAFEYAGDSNQSMINYTYKRKLQSVLFLNQNEEELERYKFEYSLNNSSLGSLTKITLPSGGSIQYELEKSDIEMKLDVSRSDFANIDVGLSPTDFRDENGDLIPVEHKWVPQVYYGEDYVVIIWAQFYETQESTVLVCPHVRLYAFQWDGRWLPSGLIFNHQYALWSNTDSDLKVHYATNQKVYDLRIPITIQKDFFAVKIPRSGNDPLCIVTKTNRRNSQFAEWNLNIPDNIASYGDKIRSLISGDNYVIAFADVGNPYNSLPRIFRYDYNEFSKLWNDNLPISPWNEWGDDYPDLVGGKLGFGTNNWYWASIVGNSSSPQYIVRKDRFKRWMSKQGLGFYTISYPIASSKDLVIGLDYSSPDYIYRYRGLGEQSTTNHTFKVRDYDPDTVDETIGAGGRAIINGETVCHVNSMSTEATTMFDDIPLYNRLYRYNGDHWTRFEASVDNANSYDARGNFAQSCSDVASVSYLKVRVDPDTPFWTLIGLDFIQIIPRMWKSIFEGSSIDYSNFLSSNNRCYYYNANTDSWNELFANTDKWGTFSRLPLCSNNIVGWYTSVDSVGGNWSGHSNNWFNASKYQLAFRNSLPNSTSMWSENSINEANVSDMAVFDDYYIMNIHSSGNTIKTPSIYLRNRDLSWPSTPQAIPNTNPNLSLEVVDSFCSSDAFALLAIPYSGNPNELHLYKILNNQYMGKVNDLRVSSVSFNDGTGLVSRVNFRYSGGNCSPSGNTATYYKVEEIPETDPTFITLRRNGSTSNYYFNGLTAWDLDEAYGVVESQEANTPFGDVDMINNYLTDLTGISFRKESYRANEVQPFNSETGLFKVIDRDVFKESCRTVQKTSSTTYKDGIETIISYRC